MVFNDVKLPGDLAKSQDWNDFVDFAEEISSNSYKFSSNSINLFSPSTLSNDRYLEYVGHSGNTNIHINHRNNITTIVDSYGEIEHGLPSIPNYWNVKPSGTINFGITTNVDATKIYVYLTAIGNRDVYWYASI